jgi:hypothetical protein
MKVQIRILSAYASSRPVTLYHATSRMSIALTITADRPKNLN